MSYIVKDLKEALNNIDESMEVMINNGRSYNWVFNAEVKEVDNNKSLVLNTFM